MTPPDGAPPARGAPPAPVAPAATPPPPTATPPADPAPYPAPADPAPYPPPTYPAPYPPPTYPAPYPAPAYPVQYPPPAYPPGTYGYPPTGASPYAPPYPYAPAPAPAPPTVAWGPVALGLVGAILALIGAALPWLTFRSCTDLGGTAWCFPFPMPLGFSPASYNAFLPVAAPLAALLVGTGALLFIPNKAPYALAAAAMAAAGLLVAVAFVLVAGSLVDTMGADLTAMDVTVSIRAGIGVGPYFYAAGALLVAIGGTLNWKALKDMAARKAASGAAEPAAPVAAPR